jgi:hypothetical protein
MNSINDERGCSVCQPGKENYTTYNTKLKGQRVRTSTTTVLKVVNSLLVVRLP